MPTRPIKLSEDDLAKDGDVKTVTSSVGIVYVRLHKIAPGVILELKHPAFADIDRSRLSEDARETVGYPTVGVYANKFLHVQIPIPSTDASALEFSNFYFTILDNYDIHCSAVIPNAKPQASVFVFVPNRQ
jgi:hypothetical protein